MCMCVCFGEHKGSPGVSGGQMDHSCVDLKVFGVCDIAG